MNISKTMVLAVGIVFLFVLVSCFNRGTTTGKLYFEPPARLIEDYTGMVEVDELNWAWTQPGLRLSNYQSLDLKPVINLTEVEDSTVAASLFEGLTAWFTDAGFKPSDSGQISCEGAIVALRVEKTFWEKINPFREKEEDYAIQFELVIKAMPAQTLLCKIRHGVTSFQKEQLASKLLSGLLSYCTTHK